MSRLPPHRIPPAHAWGIAAVTTCAVGYGLWAAQEALDIPRQLVITLAVCFVAWLGISFVLRVRASRSILAYVCRLVIPWAIMSSVLLSVIYQVDRAGWIWYQITGFNESIPEDYTDDVSISAEDFVDRHPDFRLDRSEGTSIRLPAGEYVFERTIVVPQGTRFVIEAGTRILMDAGCSLISYSPVEARGTPDRPIQIAARRRWLKWGVLGVVGASQSVFEHVQLQDARHATVNGLSFPGGLSVIETAATIRHCLLTNMYGKDAIYICRAHAVIEGNRVETAFKDGIDLDGATGEIRGNHLIDCEDDAVDLSEDSRAELHQNTIRDRRGGRIAVHGDLEKIRTANILEYSHRD